MIINFLKYFIEKDKHLIETKNKTIREMKICIK